MLGEASGAEDESTALGGGSKAPPTLLLELVRHVVFLGTPGAVVPSAVESDALLWLRRSLEGPKNAQPLSITGAV